MRTRMIVSDNVVAERVLNIWHL